jgi:mono/diheme cytochrome c family protein
MNATSIPRWLGRLAAAVLLAPAAAGASPAREPGPGAQIFQRVCSACHGERGDGRSLASTALRTSPRDFTTEEARTGLTREYMVAIVRDGRPHTAMVGRTQRLSQEEIEAVVDFIRAAFMPPEPGTVLAAGRLAYRKACAACHGDRGQGGAPRARSPAAPPISAARAGPELTAERMTQALIRPQHVPGAAVAGLPLSDEEAGAVVAYVRAAFIEAGAGRRDAGTP